MEFDVWLMTFMFTALMPQASFKRYGLPLHTAQVCQRQQQEQ